MRKVFLVSLVVLLASAFIFSSCAAPVTAPKAPATEPKAISLKDFYEGNALILVVATFPASSQDLVARLLAPSVTEQIGSKIIIKNMGEGGTEGTNWIATKAKPDGLNLLQTPYVRDVLNQVSGTPGVLYDFFKLRMVVDTFSEPNAIGVSNKYKTFQDLVQAKGIKGGSSATRGMSASSLFSLFESTGIDGKVITGFQGSSAQALAMAKGEIDLMAFPLSTIKRLVIDPGYGHLLCVMSQKRSSLYPDTPTIYELGKVSSDIASILACSGQDGNIVVAPPGIAQDKLDFLRNAYETILKDKGVVQNLTMAAGGTPHMWAKGTDIEAQLAKVANDKGLGGRMVELGKKYLATK